MVRIAHHRQRRVLGGIEGGGHRLRLAGSSSCRCSCRHRHIVHRVKCRRRGGSRCKRVHLLEMGGLWPSKGRKGRWLSGGRVELRGQGSGRRRTGGRLHSLVIGRLPTKRRNARLLLVGPDCSRLSHVTEGDGRRRCMAAALHQQVRGAAVKRNTAA